MADKCILIIDDSTESIDILVDLLKETYKIKAAPNGKLGLKIAGSPSPPDLIILDIVMPEMDGYEVCRELKANNSTSDIPVIFMSATSDSDTIKKIDEVGGADLFSKPIEPDTVTSMVKKYLS
ncbi:MAG: response regulator [Leptospirales bacterium]